MAYPKTPCACACILGADRRTVGCFGRSVHARRRSHGRGALAALSMEIMGMNARPSQAARDKATVTQVRNATLRINYGGVRFLVDPMLADKSTYPGFPGSANSELRNPLVPLPMPVADIIDVDAVIVTHL